MASGLKQERLLTRLAECWWRTGKGNPGFGWMPSREALNTPKAKAALAELNWKPAASDKELYAAFVSGIAKGGWKASDIDSWDQGEALTEARTMQQRDLQKRSLKSSQSHSLSGWGGESKGKAKESYKRRRCSRSMASHPHGPYRGQSVAAGLRKQPSSSGGSQRRRSKPGCLP